MQKNNFFGLVALCCICGSMFCSNPFKSSTSSGQDIVESIDSSVTNVSENIKIFLTSAILDSVYSRCDIGDSVPRNLYRGSPSYLSAGNFTGLSNNGNDFSEEAISYVEFRTGLLRTSSWSGVRKALRDAYSIDSMKLFFDRVKVNIDSAYRYLSAKTTTSIDVFACGVQKDSVLFNKDSIHHGDSTTFTVSLDSSGTDSVYFARLDTSYRTLIRKAVRDSACDTPRFAFCLKGTPGSSGVARFYDLGGTTYSPRITFYYRPKSDTAKTKNTTLSRDHAEFSLFENSFENDSSNGASSCVSARGVMRRSVLKLDVSSLKAFMQDSAPENKDFVVIQRADLYLNASHIRSDMRGDSILVYYNVSDTLAGNKHGFKKYSSFHVRISVGADTSYVLPLASWLQPLIINRNSSTVYLYLSLPVETSLKPFAQIAWSDTASKLKLNTIVTNPR
jgi:hypothetical protein